MVEEVLLLGLMVEEQEGRMEKRKRKKNSM